LTGKSSSKDLSSDNKRSSLTGSHDNNTTGYNTTGYNTTAATSTAGAGALGAGALGSSQVSENNPHAIMQGDRPIVGAIPVHPGKDAESTNNPSFVLPASAGQGQTAGGLHSTLESQPLGHLEDSTRDHTTHDAFSDPSHHRGSGATTGLVGSNTNTSTTGERGNLERTGTGRLSKSLSGRGFGDGPHETGHIGTNTEFDPKLATHDHQHLQHVTHREVRHVEVEEVERKREIDRHVHHVQTHIQPVVDKKILPEQIHENLIAPTKVHEKHASTTEDVKLFESLATQHKDTEVHRPKERTVVDLGEKVTENIIHHVHHVTQPVIEQEVVERHRIHTVIPVHHVTHEAPIIHKSSTHAPVSIDDFVKGGGQLDSKKTYNNVGLLPTDDCNREVDGEAERLVESLNLSKNHHYAGHSHKSGESHSHGTSSSSGLHQAKDGDLHKTAIAAKVDDMTPSSDRIGSTQKI